MRNTSDHRSTLRNPYSAGVWICEILRILRMVCSLACRSRGRRQDGRRAAASVDPDRRTYVPYPVDTPAG